MSRCSVGIHSSRGILVFFSLRFFSSFFSFLSSPFFSFLFFSSCVEEVGRGAGGGGGKGECVCVLDNTTLDTIGFVDIPYSHIPYSISYIPSMALSVE